MSTKTSPYSAFQKALMDRIQAQLELKPMNTRELAAALEANYYSVRQAQETLITLGLIKPQNPMVRRNTVWMLADANGPNRIVPLVQINGETYKASNLTGLTLAKQTDAINGIGPAICRLMAAAIRSHEGTPQPTEIARAKTALGQAEKELQKLLGLVQQFTTNERFWDADLLAKFPQDPDFNAEQIAKHYQVYFATEE